MPVLALTLLSGAAQAATAATSLADVVLADGFEACQRLLLQLGASFTAGPAMPGVVDPVTVNPPLNGIAFTASGVPDADLYMDCRLALVLHRVAGDLVARGIDTVDHLGTYNYRCIAGTGTTPPNCTLSDHSFGTAIDFASFSGGGMTYSVLTDWVIDPPPLETCTAATENAKDEFLHRLACGWHDAGFFNIILTPNFNANFRNHLHVDLTAGSNFIR